MQKPVIPISKNSGAKKNRRSVISVACGGVMFIISHRTLPENSTPPSIVAKLLHGRNFENAVGLILADYYSYWQGGLSLFTENPRAKVFSETRA